MAFVKRNWLARIGIGLNKFIIGDRDSQGKRTLTNSPDSVSQEGDVISADNLNDLEDRIDSAFSGVETEIDGMKWKRVWTNPDPNENFSAQTVSLGSTYRDIMIFYEPIKAYTTQIGKRVKIRDNSSGVSVSKVVTLTYIDNNKDLGELALSTRDVAVYISGDTKLDFADGVDTVFYIGSPTGSAQSALNSICIPIYIYVATTGEA